MEEKYWKSKWETLDIKFHRSSPNPNLVKYFAKFPPGDIFVPLCGKSLDMQWLAEHKRGVVGAELSEKAVELFFAEHHLKYTARDQEGFKVFSSGSVTIWLGDFFKLPAAATANVSSVFDRAALVALPPDMRDRYRQKMRELFSDHPELAYLLVTFEYEQSAYAGPPFSVDEVEVRSFFAEDFAVELLERHQGDELRRGDEHTTLTECVYFATRRSQ